MIDNQQGVLEHLKMVQGIITRMAGYSMQMKTWAISLVTAVFVFSGLSDGPHWLIGLGGCIPVIAFWSMDAKYLHLERCYIKLYEAVMTGASEVAFDLNYRPFIATVDSVWRVAWSWSVCRFYGLLLTMMIALLATLAV